jgi:hypothetical protein
LEVVTEAGKAIIDGLKSGMNKMRISTEHYNSENCQKTLHHWKIRIFGVISCMTCPGLEGENLFYTNYSELTIS